MEYILIISAWICGIIGVIGAVAPIIPGPAISFVAIFLLYFCDTIDISVTELLVTGIFMGVVTILDYILPIWFTSLSNGSKHSTRGATAGLLLGLFFSPWGLIIGPVIGAFLGELIAASTTRKALEVAMMSFVGFLVTTGLKLVYCVFVLAAIGWKSLAVLFD